MITANATANVIGVGIILLLRHGPLAPVSPRVDGLVLQTHLVFLPFAFALPVLTVLFYERPIRQYLDQRYAKNHIPREATILARQRLLNEPFFMIALNLSVWLAATIIYPSVLWAFNAPRLSILQALFMSLNTGLITTAVSFFLLEHILQRRVVPLFFPTAVFSKRQEPCASISAQGLPPLFLPAISCRAYRSWGYSSVRT